MRPEKGQNASQGKHNYRIQGDENPLPGAMETHARAAKPSEDQTEDQNAIVFTGLGVDVSEQDRKGNGQPGEQVSVAQGRVGGDFIE